MRQLVACLIAALCAATTGIAQNYSTVATLTRHAGSDHFEVNAVISELVVKDGEQVEKVISRPKILSAAGLPASLYAGPSSQDPDYQTKDNFSMDISWPRPGDSGMAICSVVIKRGDKTMSKFKFQLQVEDQ